MKEFDEGDGVRINALSFDPNHPRLAFGTSGRVITIVDTTSLKVVDRYRHVEGGILSLGYLADGALAIVSAYGRLLYFNAGNARLKDQRRATSCLSLPQPRLMQGHPG